MGEGSAPLPLLFCVSTLAQDLRTLTACTRGKKIFQFAERSYLRLARLAIDQLAKNHTDSVSRKNTRLRAFYGTFEASKVVLYHLFQNRFLGP